MLMHPAAVLSAILLFVFLNHNDFRVSDTTDLTDEEAPTAIAYLFPQAEMSTEEEYITIPLKNAGRLFMVEAVIDGQTGNLIFDTGASGIVLNRTYFRKYISVNSQKSNGVTGSVGDVSVINVGSLTVSGMEMKKFPASVADLSHIENQKGVKVLGLFGFEIIRNFEIIIDIKRQTLQLFKIDKHGNRISNLAPAFIANQTQKFETSKGVLFLKGFIAGKELKFCFDTGAETNVISSSVSKSVLKTITISHRSNLKGVGTSRSEVLTGIMTDFRFGDREMPSMSGVITNLNPLCEAYDTSIDGMLGYDFLIKGIFCINFAKKQIGVIYPKNK